MRGGIALGGNLSPSGPPAGGAGALGLGAGGSMDVRMVRSISLHCSTRPFTYAFSTFSRSSKAAVSLAAFSCLARVSCSCWLELPLAWPSRRACSRSKDAIMRSLSRGAAGSPTNNSSAKTFTLSVMALGFASLLGEMDVARAADTCRATESPCCPTALAAAAAWGCLAGAAVAEGTRAGGAGLPAFLFRCGGGGGAGGGGALPALVFRWTGGGGDGLPTLVLRWTGAARGGPELPGFTCSGGGGGGGGAELHALVLR
mmetsp:Transcript_33876/g.95956  ORF Transcript_33876/g.95956 Transcript_33876/m.95956 type:complete len:258 (+) Transcript_33876:3350-4123(+)